MKQGKNEADYNKISLFVYVQAIGMNTNGSPKTGNMSYNVKRTIEENETGLEKSIRGIMK